MRGGVVRVVEDREGSTPRASLNPLWGGVYQVVENREVSRRDHGDRRGHASSSGRRGIPEQERAHSGGDGLRRRDPPLGRRAPLAAPSAVSSPPRRRPTGTHVSQERRDAERGQSHAPVERRGVLAPVGDKELPALQGACATLRAGFIAAMTSSGRVHRPARRASSGARTRTFYSNADTTPTLLLLARRVPVLPRGLGRARRKAAALALWTARGLRHHLGIVPALLPRRRHARAIRPSPLRAHARPPGPRLPIVRWAWLCTTRREGGTRPALAPDSQPIVVSSQPLQCDDGAVRQEGQCARVHAAAVVVGRDHAHHGDQPSGAPHEQ